MRAVDDLHRRVPGAGRGVYTLFSIYPADRHDPLSLYAADGTGATHFVGLGNFVTLLTDPNWSGPFWNAFRNNLIFFAIHMVVQNSIGLALAVLLSLPALAGAQRLPHADLPADDAVGRHHRLHLAAHPLAALGHRQGRARPRSVSAAGSRPGSGWKAPRWSPSR